MKPDGYIYVITLIEELVEMTIACFGEKSSRKQVAISRTLPGNPPPAWAS
ncbi:MAG: hypothetical protein V1793_07030 [Pseudomonadota bacterium]